MNIKTSNKFVLAISSGNFFESACVSATGLALPYWSLKFGFDGYENGVLGALGHGFGSAVGALIGGWLSDKFGRKKAYIIGLLSLLIGCLLCAFSDEFFGLALGFLFMGLGMGICVPVAWNYMAELSEAKDRSVNIGLGQLARPVAIVLMYVIFLVFSIVLPSTGEDGQLLPTGSYGIFDGLLSTRLFFIILAIICVISLILQKDVQESEDWKQKKNKLSDNLNFKKIFVNKKTIITMILLIFLYTPWNIVAGTMTQFMPTMAKTVEIEGTFLGIISVAICVVSLVSVYVFPKVVNNFSHRALFAFGCITGALGMIFMLMVELQFLYLGNSLWWIIILFVLCWGGQTGFSAQCFYSIWSTELFPTQVRGQIQGIMFFLIRALTGFWSLFVFGVLNASTNLGAAITISIMASFIMIGFVFGMIVCPNTKGKSLDQITQERYGDLLNN